MWTDLIHYAEATSTNDLARDHATNGADEGTLVVADYQAAGRGRKGRVWFAPPGTSLLCSLILRPPSSVAHSAWLTLAGGIAVVDALSELTDLQPRLKWPNDVLIGGLKVAGVLAESFREGNGTVCVLGVGINVNQQVEQFPSELADQATSLALQAGREYRPADLLEPLRQAFKGYYDRLLADDAETLRQRWCDLDLTIGHPVEVTSPTGDYRGRACAIDEYGALWVEDLSGEAKRVVVGDVSVRIAE